MFKSNKNFYKKKNSEVINLTGFGNLLGFICFIGFLRNYHFGNFRTEFYHQYALSRNGNGIFAGRSKF